MDTFLQQIINGLVQGSIYALVALGYTMVYGIMGLINFAHGEVVMIGTLVAMTTTFKLVAFGFPLWLAAAFGVLAAVIACMILGWGLERVAYRPLRHAPRLTPLITAIGMSIVLQNLAMMLWSRNYMRFPDFLPKVNYEVAGAHFTSVQVIIVLTSAIMMSGLLLLIFRTKLGMAMRATAQNPHVASLMGVNISRVIATAFIIGSALAAVAGILVGSYYEIAHYQMGTMLGMKAFTAAVLGGIGNIGGAVVGGLLLGLIEAFGAGYLGDLTNVCMLSRTFGILTETCAQNPTASLVGSNYQDILAFFVLIAVLMLRPSGLLGEKTGERA
jgi:branched-chain amino acid transport system permease protein